MLAVGGRAASQHRPQCRGHGPLVVALDPSGKAHVDEDYAVVADAQSLRLDEAVVFKVSRR